jgi:hypothetical protein
MMHRILAGIVPALAISTSLHAGAADTLVYADFEKVEGGRPVSSRGGYIGMYSYEENLVRKATYKGAEGLDPPGPAIVRIKPDDPNHAMKFDYSLLAPNQWTGVAVEIHGLPDADGKARADDVSGYRFLSLQVYATGISILRIETRANETGKETRSVFPIYQMAIKPGLNTYRVPLTGFTQPAWLKDTRVDPKDILKKLTSLALIAFCDECDQSKQGMVIVDNIVFEK